MVGVGAVGGYFGGRLLQAGHDVRFVARGATLEALLSDGLRVQSIAGDFHIAQPAVTDDPSRIGPVDLLLFSVKAWQVRDVALAAAALAGPDTVIVPLQNGLEAPTLLGEVFGPQRVLGGLCRIFAQKTGPATILHSGLEPSIELGELDGSRSERVERILAELGSTAGMKVVAPESIRAAMWEKLLYVEPMGVVGAASRQPAGVVRTLPEMRRLLRATMVEVAELAGVRGVPLDPALPDRVMARLDVLPAEATSSMHRDIVAGLPSELDFQTGTIVRYARESGFAAPCHETLYAALLPLELQARGTLPAPA